MNAPPRLFDSVLVQQHLARRPRPGSFVFDLVVDDLADRLGTLVREFPRAAIIGPDPDLLPETGTTASHPIRFERYGAFAGEDEVPDLGKGSYNLIVSLLHQQAPSPRRACGCRTGPSGASPVRSRWRWQWRRA